jgi:hypothetical protein
MWSQRKNNNINALALYSREGEISIKLCNTFAVHIQSTGDKELTQEATLRSSIRHKNKI